MTVIFSIASFILVLGILVTVHEFGHFWVARRCGVKVLRFSVGFGKPLLTFRRKNDPTEYVIAGIPLGGYVKMLDEGEGEVSDDEKHLAFNNKPLLSRFLIVLAGPAFNLIFAFFTFWAILTIGESGLKPIVSVLDEKGIAIHSGMEIGDEIIAVNDRPVGIWRVASGLLSSELLSTGEVEVTVKKAGGQLNKVILAFSKDDIPEPNEVAGKIGIEPLLPHLKPYIGQVLTGGAGAQAGLKAGDLVLSVDKQLISTWAEWVKSTRSHPNRLMSVQVQRGDERLLLSITPKSVEDNGKLVGRIGVNAQFDKDEMALYYANYSLNGFSAIKEAATQTFSYSLLTLKVIGRMIIGEASVQNLSGPISLAEYAGKTASFGLVPFLKFLAFVSISLGVMNLMPIPMLDGGHLFFYMLEAIKGKPVSDVAQAVFMRLGMVVLFSMMLLAVFVDVSRLIG